MPRRAEKNSIEVQVLVACARKVMDAAQRSRFTELVAQPLDWTFLLQRANDNGLLPLLHKHLTEAATDSMRADVLKQISQANRESALRGLLLTAELLRVLDAFANEEFRQFHIRGQYSRHALTATRRCASLRIWTL